MVKGLSSGRISLNADEKGEIMTINVKGNFDFNVVREFRSAYSGPENTPRKLIVDMRHTASIDSAALGMLLNMKKYFNKADGDIEIQNCSPAVKRVLSIARFDMLFRID